MNKQQHVRNEVAKYNEVLAEKPGFLLIKTAVGPAVVTWVSVPMTWEHKRPNVEAPVFWALPNSEEGRLCWISAGGNAGVAQYIQLKAVRLEFYRRPLTDLEVFAML